VRQLTPKSTLLGIDVNPLNVERGRALYDLDLRVGDDNWLSEQDDDSVDVSFTVSVLDHIPFPEAALRHLLRISSQYLVLFELAHDRVGRATHNAQRSGDVVTLTEVYRYSYIHDYRYECERKLGATCVVDVRFPIGPNNLLDLYRLYVFTKRAERFATPSIATLKLTPSA
jgi:SAM-dependent methyltransferase